MADLVGECHFQPVMLNTLYNPDPKMIKNDHMNHDQAITYLILP